MGVGNDKDLIKYHETGCLVIKTPHNHDLKFVCETMDQIVCPYEDMTTTQITERLPITDIRQYEPAKRSSDDDFGEPTGPSINGAVFFPHGGYVNDPKLSSYNAQRAA